MASPRDLTLPVLEGNKTQCFPHEAACPMCSKPFNGAFAVLSAGALLMNRKEDTGGMSDDLDAFMNLVWHGGDINDDVYATQDIVRDLEGGQFDLQFCSTSCLRAFFNACVDKLDERVAQNRDEMARHKQSDQEE